MLLILIHFYLIFIKMIIRYTNFIMCMGGGGGEYSSDQLCSTLIKDQFKKNCTQKHFFYYQDNVLKVEA